MKSTIFNEFTKKFSKKNCNIFDINLLMKDDKDSFEQIKYICDDLIELFFDFTFDGVSEIKKQENENNEKLDEEKIDKNNDDKDFEFDKDESKKNQKM